MKTRTTVINPSETSEEDRIKDLLGELNMDAETLLRNQLGEEKEDGSEIENNVDFKVNLMKASSKKLLPNTFTKDLFLGNIDAQEKQKVQRYFSFIIKLRAYGLTKSALYFERKIFAIINPTRSYKGFQQEKLITQGLTQSVDIKDTRPSRYPGGTPK